MHNYPPKKQKKALTYLLSIVIIVSFLLTLTAIPNDSSIGSYNSNSPIETLAWLSQLLISFIATVASLSEIAGLNLKDLVGGYKKPAQAQYFPFEIIQNINDFENLLYPSVAPNVSNDKQIPYFPRLDTQIDKEFQIHGRVLLFGKSKTGKTREVLETLRRWWITHPTTTVLVAKDFARFNTSFDLPPNLATQNIVVFFDNLDQFCTDDEAIKSVIKTISFFSQISHDPSSLRVIATVREEPEFLNKLKLEKHYWNDFGKVSLPTLSLYECKNLITVLANHFKIAIDDQVVSEIAHKNDGTILNIILSFRYWLGNDISQVTEENIEFFHGSIIHTWNSRYKSLINTFPLVSYIYSAIKYLQDMNIPLQRDLVIWVSSEFSLPKIYHYLTGYFSKIEMLIALSPKINWIKDSKTRHRMFFFMLVLLVFLLYISTYLLFKFYSYRNIHNYLSALNQDNWLVSPFVFLTLFIPSAYLLLLASSVFLKFYRNIFTLKIERTVDMLTSSEIRMQKNALLPYDNQCSSVSNLEVFSLDILQNSFLKELILTKLGIFISNVAEECRLSGEFDAAQEVALKAASFLPKHPEPYYILGNVEFDKKNYLEAKQYFLKSAELDTSATQAFSYERCAWACYRMGKYEDTIVYANKSLRNLPKHPGALWALGIARIKKNSIIAGVKDITTATKLSPDDVPLDVEILIQKGLAEKDKWALELSNEIQNSKPTLSGFALNLRYFNILLSILLVGFGVWGVISAPEIYSKYRYDNEYNRGGLVTISNVMLVIYPNTPFWIGARAQGYSNNGEYGLAVDDLTKCIQLLPDPGFYNNRGIAYLKMGEYELAINDFSESIILDPTDSRGYNNRGNVYNAIGEFEKAQLDYSKAESLGW